MPYELIVTPEPEDKAVRLNLNDPDGTHKGNNVVLMREHRLSLWEGLFDTRRYVNRYAGQMRDEDDMIIEEDRILKELGVFLGQKILGPEIMEELTSVRARRTLLIRIPKTGGENHDNGLAAAFARVPWEIARSEENGGTLMDYNLIVRVITDDMPEPHSAVIRAADQVNNGGEPLRILFVFAEAPGSRPLAMRLEREQILKIFSNEIMPKKNVRIDILGHGVTRKTLKEQVRTAKGYHMVHWSGHGHHNTLELRGENGGKDYITGEDLAALFEDAGGFIPQFVFLSACLSGAFVDIRAWETLRAALRGETPDAKDSEAGGLDQIVGRESGYTGTALALLKSRVPQVAAMRYEVGDDYARELAARFYKRCLADSDRVEAADALATARSDLLDDAKEAGRLGPVNHATPILFGHGGWFLSPKKSRSPQMKELRPRPQPLLPSGIRELDPQEIFVGRGEIMTDLQAKWLLAPNTPIALIQGLAGLGKTAIAAESIHLWHTRFDYVLAFQAKPAPLTLDEFLRTMDARLAMCSQTYMERCESSPFDKIFLEPGQPLTGAERYDKLRVNLLETLRDEAVLIVIDNFETNLEDVIKDGVCRCREPEWDRTLEFLCRELPETRTRILMTSRLRPAGLLENAQWVPLGPLPVGEAALFVRNHPDLRELLYSGEEGERLLKRLLDISRGHPLILNRLAALAHDPKALADAIETLSAEGLSALPDVYTSRLSESERSLEREYLEDAAVGAVDLLIGRLSPDARRLLWMTTLANEALTKDLIQTVWGAGSSLPPLLDELRASGLLHREDAAPETAGVTIRTYAFHELVRERMAHWMETHPEETGRSKEDIWTAYGERYAATFNALIQAGGEGAYERAGEAGRRALTYMVRAGAFDRLRGFASKLVVGTKDPALLKSVIAELKTVADQIPPDETRWSVRTYLADAIRLSGRPDQSLALYEQAASEAEAEEDWSDVGWICGNWANALGNVGRLDQSREMHMKSADSNRKAGKPEVNVLSPELEALRIDVMQGKAEAALPEIESRLDQIREWWKTHRSGRPTPQAPDPEFLVRALIGGLDIAKMANQRLKNWQACLDLLEENEQTKRDMGQNRHDNTVRGLISTGR